MNDRYRFWSKISPVFRCSRINLKGETLTNVDASDRLYSPANSSEAIFAVGKYGAGFVAYFSDVNQERGTIKVILEFLVKAKQKTADAPQRPLGEFDVREPPVKVTCSSFVGSKGVVVVVGLV